MELGEGCLAGELVMNAQLFKQVELMAQDMLSAAECDDETSFYQHQGDLKSLCDCHAGKKNDHPVLWETLADFTEDNLEAIALYRQAYKIADKLKDTEYKASIQFSLAQRLFEQGEIDQANEALLKAEKFAGFTEDIDMQNEIAALIKSSS